MATTLILVAATFAQSPGAAIQILEPTMYHGDEVHIPDTIGWLGLFQTNDAVELRPVELVVETVNDPIVDAENEATGKQISVAGDRQPFLLIHGLNAATPGPVTTQVHGDRFIQLGETLPLKSPFEGGAGGCGPAVGNPSPEIWHLAALGEAIDDGHNILIENYAVKLIRNLWSRDNQRQTLATIDQVDIDGSPRLLWAGDLDNDQKPDLLLDLTDHYNVRNLTLFLSTHAAEGELVGKAAQLRTTGC